MIDFRMVIQIVNWLTNGWTLVFVKLLPRLKNKLIKKKLCRSRIVRASRHRRDRTMSVLLLTIVIVFIICNVARVACNLFEAFQVKHQIGVFTVRIFSWVSSYKSLNKRIVACQHLYCWQASSFILLYIYQFYRRVYAVSLNFFLECFSIICKSCSFILLHVYHSIEFKLRFSNSIVLHVH